MPAVSADYLEAHMTCTDGVFDEREDGVINGWPLSCRVLADGRIAAGRGDIKSPKTSGGYPGGYPGQPGGGKGAWLPTTNQEPNPVTRETYLSITPFLYGPDVRGFSGGVAAGSPRYVTSGLEPVAQREAVLSDGTPPSADVRATTSQPGQNYGMTYKRKLFDESSEVESGAATETATEFDSMEVGSPCLKGENGTAGDSPCVYMDRPGCNDYHQEPTFSDKRAEVNALHPPIRQEHEEAPWCVRDTFRGPLYAGKHEAAAVGVLRKKGGTAGDSPCIYMDCPEFDCDNKEHTFSDKNTRKHLGVFIKLEDDHSTLANMSPTQPCKRSCQKLVCESLGKDGGYDNGEAVPGGTETVDNCETIETSSDSDTAAIKDPPPSPRERSGANPDREYKGCDDTRQGNAGQRHPTPPAPRRCAPSQGPVSSIAADQCRTCEGFCEGLPVHPATRPASWAERPSAPAVLQLQPQAPLKHPAALAGKQGLRSGKTTATPSTAESCRQDSTATVTAVTKDVVNSTAVVQLTRKTEEGEKAEYGAEDVSWELHTGLKWGLVEIGSFVKDGQDGGWYKWPRVKDTDSPLIRFILQLDVAVREDKGQYFVPSHNKLKAMYDSHMRGLEN
ncbi:hypothetical protein Bbelb_019450 [Branchiostoma belcheri]|nr:hypothetical protein Bbelb_019450 [Branchiostoma belcheri]